uniref:Uncharacterized protein n=1 Tax=Knipowitschia caucasica TaxID=637954 RepID=A0AAV2JVW0_KNICA
MRRTRKDTAAKQAIASEMTQELGVDNTALAKTIEEIMSKYFEEADEKSEARSNRLVKRLDNMHATLSRHTEDIKALRSDTTQLQERASGTEMQLQSLSEKIVEMEDPTIKLSRDHDSYTFSEPGEAEKFVAAYKAENG